ncbi:MAG: ArsA family ATPase [Oligoflexia bacterium]|nr:ArsA family ATPase [Oligoflexia bacterium]
MVFDKLLEEKKVLICCGSGGVGKTSLSAALGLRAAELGKKVLVMTIDPAKRLANALGLENLYEIEKRVPTQKGELYAEMLDMKRTFDDFIYRLAPTPEAAQKVLANIVYQQLSTALNGSQEYTALERLLQAHTSGKFDLIILDTPPTKHAMDFLNAPAKIHTLFQESIMKWFLMPFSTLDKLSLGLMNRGTKAAFKMLERLAGSEFISTISEFFSAIRDWQKTLRDRTAEVHRLLTNQGTGFVLITGFNSVKIEEARFFENSLKKGGYQLSGIIVNRAFPLWANADSGILKTDKTADEALNKLKKHYQELKRYYQIHLQAYTAFEKELRQNVLFLKIPDLSQDINSINGLKNLMERL